MVKLKAMVKVYSKHPLILHILFFSMDPEFHDHNLPSKVPANSAAANLSNVQVPCNAPNKCVMSQYSDSM
uniref:Uncharacterized protein n=1 Tax=Arundo donax TaxID=35708 RepID=A0A0A9AVE9_ARUDO